MSATQSILPGKYALEATIMASMKRHMVWSILTLYKLPLFLAIAQLIESLQAQHAQTRLYLSQMGKSRPGSATNSAASQPKTNKPLFPLV